LIALAIGAKVLLESKTESRDVEQMNEYRHNLLRFHLPFFLLHSDKWIPYEAEKVQCIGRIAREDQQEIEHHDVLSREVEDHYGQHLD
jgi:hypothetical protein